MDRGQLLHDLLFCLAEALRDRGEALGEHGIGRLRGEGLRPVEGEVEVASTVVESADAPRGASVLVENPTCRGVESRREDRGAGETRACGSGACAAMTILHNADLVENEIKVAQMGGNLIINWTKGDKSVIMKGHATHVFEGNLA